MNDIVIQKIQKNNINSAEQFLIILNDLMGDMLIMNQKDRAKNFTCVMDKARELQVEESVYKIFQDYFKVNNEPELWEEIKPFTNETTLKPFPIDKLPDTLRDYVINLSENIQVSADMVAVYLLSVLSLCLQGKACISHMNTQHTEPLNLYIAVVAKPAERKTSVSSNLMKPVYDFEKYENERLKPQINAYQDMKGLYMHELDNHKKKGDIQSMQKARKNLESLKPVYPLKLNVTDTTTEALAVIMQENNGRIGLLSSEGGIFETIAGRYSNGIPNMDLYLNGYDGSPVSILRRTGDIKLDNPLLTMGFLVQPDVLNGMLNNSAFCGRGFTQRFLFSFPNSKVGERKATGKPMDNDIQRRYDELITRLLNMKYSDNIPVIHMNNKSCIMFEEFFNKIEAGLKPDGEFSSVNSLAEWAGKLCGKVLRIAGILHLCEHSADEILDELTMQRAVFIGSYFIDHAKQAFEVMGNNADSENAIYVLSKLKQLGKECINKSELKRICRKFNTIDELNSVLELLEDCNYIRIITQQNTKARATTLIKVNPAMFDF